MKTNFFFTKKTSIYSILGVFALVATSCGSYQNSSYYDNDGVYGATEKPKPTEVSNANSGYYKDYFSSLNKENEQVFTDVDKYSTYNDTLKKSNQNNTEVQNTSGYASWGSNPDNVTVNVYNSGWGYNSWYGPNWGYYGGGYYGNYWGYNNWYGNSWGYTPSWAWSWGWNSWYGPSWYGYYGYGYNPYGYYPYGYGYYASNWAWSNGNSGHIYAHSGGRRNTNFTGSGFGSPNRSMAGNGGRSVLGGNRVVGEPSSIPRNYNNTGTPRNSYAPRTNETVSPRPTNPNNNNYNTPRNYTPSTPSTPRSYDSPRSYTPSTPRSYDSPRSYTPSGGGSYGGGGGSYGGGGGGRSGGGGGRR